MQWRRIKTLYTRLLETFYSISGLCALNMSFFSGLSQMACPKLEIEEGETCHCKEPGSSPKRS